MIPSSRALAASFGKVHVYSHDIIDANGKWILKINNRFAGIYQSRALANEFLRGVISSTGGTAGQQVIEDGRLPTANRIVRERSTDLIRRFYHQVLLSTNGTGTNNWNDWRDSTIRTFTSKPDSANGSWPNWRGGRAFGANNAATDANWASQFNFTVPSPSTTSPWHNVIYEASQEAYRFGYRAFHYYMPFGCYDHVWMCTPMIMEDTYTSTTDPRNCKARVRGFKEAIKAMLDGNLIPENGLGPDLNGEFRPAITEACDVHIYLNGITSFNSYRSQSTAWWTASGANNTARDAAFKAYLDRFIQFVDDMQGTDPDTGILSITIDVGSFGASPSTIHMFRQRSDYVSDVVELGEWYVITELRKRGIIVNGEARSPRYVTSNYEDPPFQPVMTGGHTSGFTSDIEWFFASRPENPLTSEENLVQDEDQEWLFIMHGSYLGPSWGPYGIPSTLTNGAASRNLWTAPHPGNIYSPQHYLRFLYSCADIYCDWAWRSGVVSTKNFQAGRGIKNMACLSVDPYVINNIRCLQPGSGAGWGDGATPLGSATYTWYLTEIGLQGALMDTTWNAATFAANPSTYTGGLWTPATAAFFKDFVLLRDVHFGGARSITLQLWLDSVVADIAYFFRFTSDTVNKTGPFLGSAGDGYYTGCVDVGMRS